MRPRLGGKVIRQKMIAQATETPDQWDVIIIGGGATGLGAAVDSASRGFKTLLLEQHDFAKGTSSRSTKLIHGGLRYLQQGNVALVIEALKERGLLCQNAPHLVHHLPFLVPHYHWWEGPFYGVGLKIYDMLAGKLGIEKSKKLSRRATLKAIPTLEPQDLRGGIVYYDGQFDDSRLAICLAQTAADHGGVVINYMKGNGFDQKTGPLRRRPRHRSAFRGALPFPRPRRDQCHWRFHRMLAFCIKKTPETLYAYALPMIAPSQGVHLVLDRSFQPGNTAILVPHTSDKRVLFMVPWHDRLLLGTTDTPMKKCSLEPRPLKEEVEFLLTHAAKYLTKDPTKKDVLSMFAGLRPLIKTAKGSDTAALSRDHMIFVSKSGLVTIAGGKWTTYRKMAEDVINKAVLVGNLPERNCITTETLKSTGWHEGLKPRRAF